MTADRNAQIAERAYHLWEEAGCPAGRDMEFWLAAEAEMQAGTAAAQSPTRASRPGARAQTKSRAKATGTRTRAVAAKG